jgi:transcriptional regulator with XRE-family HTH domain
LQVKYAMNARTLAADALPHPLDIALGQSVRLRRKDLRMSQQVLADAIGVSFQQVQKYERGTNRISFSRLVEIAHTLDCRVGDLIQNLDDPGTGAQKRMEDLSKLQIPGAIELLDAYAAIKSIRLRQTVLELAHSMVDKGPASAVAI